MGMLLSYALIRPSGQGGKPDWGHPRLRQGRASPGYFWPEKIGKERGGICRFSTCTAVIRCRAWEICGYWWASILN